VVRTPAKTSAANTGAAAQRKMIERMAKSPFAAIIVNQPSKIRP